MLGEYYFILLTTSGAQITYLPLEIRNHILSFIKHTSILCINCSEVIITFKINFLCHYNGYSSLNYNCICDNCKSLYIF